jgi:23S rRNA (uracil1939-C5)-methyltransferase
MTLSNITGNIESLSFGGDGILRHEGLVIFVPLTASGDCVQVRITEKKQRFAHGELIHIESPSPLRCTPPCPYFGTCGGCQLQHLLSQPQVAAKHRFILDALQRIGKIKHIPPFEVVAAQRTWGYRRHIRLKLVGFQMGYTGLNPTCYVPIDHCPLFLESSHPLWKTLPSLLAALSKNSSDEATLRLLKVSDQDDIVLAFDFPRQIPFDARIAQQALTDNPFLKGIVMRCGLHISEWGDTSCSIETLGLRMRFSAFGFVQNHPEQSEHLYKALLDAVPKGATQILDLYCGIGITSLLLAKQGLHVIGIENHPETIQLASENAKDNAAPSALFYEGRAEELGADLLKKQHFDMVICNPPRAGLEPKLLETLTQTHPPYIAYISCMPSTLARDLRILIDAGYEIDSLQGFDLFPQTTHVETLILLKRTALA